LCSTLIRFTTIPGTGEPGVTTLGTGLGDRAGMTLGTDLGDRAGMIHGIALMALMVLGALGDHMVLYT